MPIIHMFDLISYRKMHALRLSTFVNFFSLSIVLSCLIKCCRSLHFLLNLDLPSGLGNSAIWAPWGLKVQAMLHRLCVYQVTSVNRFWLPISFQFNMTVLMFTCQLDPLGKLAERILTTSNGEKLVFCRWVFG